MTRVPEGARGVSPPQDGDSRLSTKNFGRKSLNEIKETLSSLGLSLGMTIENLPARKDLDKMREA